MSCINGACFTRYTISSSTHASFALIACLIWFVVAFAERTKLTRFAIFGFVRILGLIVFFGFGLLLLRSERSERSPLGNFWACSYFLDLVCCFYEASRAYSEIFGFVQILGLFIFF